MAAPTAPAVRASPEMAISNLVVHVTHEYTGRGPTRARTHLHEDLVTVVLEDGLSKGERSLVRGGRTDAVLEMRLAYQQTMRADFVSGIEAILDRRVAAFLSADHLDPDVAIESFVLHPRGR